MDQMLLTVKEAANVMNIGRTKVFDLIATGAIESVRIGGSRRIPVFAVEDFVAKLRSGQPE